MEKQHPINEMMSTTMEKDVYKRQVQSVPPNASQKK